jgi:putative hydrolase of the HAD superfamily
MTAAPADSVPRAVAFDMGNTLVAYYHREDFPDILRGAMQDIQGLLSDAGATTLSFDEAWANAWQYDPDSPDCKVRPLSDRIVDLFEVEDGRRDAELLEQACRLFVDPITARARVYDDSFPVLRELRSTGHRLAIISNLPWGSPTGPWREHVEEVGLLAEVDELVFCGDVGYRKPAGAIFRHTLERLGVGPERCAFIGDHPEWDVEGAGGVGMRGILIDRYGLFPDFPGERIEGLEGLPALLRAS